MAFGTSLLPLLPANQSLAGGLLARPRNLVFTVPVPTPLSQDLTVDLGAHRQLLEFYRTAGAQAVLAVASTGEMLSISWLRRGLDWRWWCRAYWRTPASAMPKP